MLHSISDDLKKRKFPEFLSESRNHISSILRKLIFEYWI